MKNGVLSTSSFTVQGRRQLLDQRGGGAVLDGTRGRRNPSLVRSTYRLTAHAQAKPTSRTM